MTPTPEQIEALEKRGWKWGPKTQVFHWPASEVAYAVITQVSIGWMVQ